MTIPEAIDDPQLLAPAFAQGDWQAWRVFLAAVYGLPLEGEGLGVYQRATGRETAPEAQAREAWAIVGRRGGKSRVAALVAVYLACFRDYGAVLAPGERGTLPIVAADRRQARNVFRYVLGLLEGCKMLARMIEHRTAESVDLVNGVTIEIHTASWRALRGYTVVGAVLDEVAFWRSDDSANPDHEIVNALRPAMATVPGALLLGISSPYARRGLVWDMYRRHHGQAGDVLVWQAPTRTMNPSVPERLVQEALERDESAARAEWLAEFRSDLEAFVSREVLEAVTVPGRSGLPPIAGQHYVGFVDPSGGAQDAFTLAIAHTEERQGVTIAVLDYLTECRPPFSPDAVVAEYAEALAAYRVTAVQGDRFAGVWVTEAFAKLGISCEQSADPKSVLYGNLLAILNSARAELLDHPRLAAQLLGLERRTARGGRDSIDHAPGAHDDLANAAAGALVAAAASSHRFIRRRDRLAGMVRDGRRHPFSALETTLRDGVAILPDAFDVRVTKPRAVHLAMAPDHRAAALAVGYVKELTAVTRTTATTVPGNGGRATSGWMPDDRHKLAPVFVIEAMLRIVPPPGDEVTLEEVLELVVRLRDDVDLPLTWVTTDVFTSVGARQMLLLRWLATGELSVPAEPRAHHELKAAIYDGRVETYDYPPLFEALGALALGAGTDAAGVSCGLPTNLVADAVAGVVWLLARRQETWDPAPRPNPPRPR